jgi:hypothetical protein
MQKNRSRDSERIWWMVLVDAEARSDACDIANNQPESNRWMLVAIHARMILRDKYKINLDTVGYKAQDLLDELYQEEVKREEDIIKHNAKADLLLESILKT